MGIFGKSDNVEQTMRKVENDAISSIIDESMIIRGEISFKGKARIDGEINGNIEGEHLILSETGKVTGDISVVSFNCYGTLEGNVKADMLTARKNCFIHGKLAAKNLTVEPGAAIDGEIKTSTREAKTTHSKSPSATPVTAPPSK